MFRKLYVLLPASIRSNSGAVSLPGRVPFPLPGSRMTPLCKRMIEDRQLKGLSASTSRGLREPCAPACRTLSPEPGRTLRGGPAPVKRVTARSRRSRLPYMRECCKTVSFGWFLGCDLIEGDGVWNHDAAIKETSADKHVEGRPQHQIVPFVEQRHHSIVGINRHPDRIATLKRLDE